MPCGPRGSNEKKKKKKKKNLFTIPLGIQLESIIKQKSTTCGKQTDFVVAGIF
jgi:hypothetical protein